MTFDPIQTELMQKIVEVATARRANWPTIDGPVDSAIEQKHLQSPTELQDQLSACRVAGPENTPAARSAFIPRRGLCMRAVGNILRHFRWFTFPH